jgi:hypothetical protein
MQWTRRGAHLLLQIRTRVLNEEWEETFRHWFPGLRPQTEEPPVEKSPELQSRPNCRFRRAAARAGAKKLR